MFKIIKIVITNLVNEFLNRDRLHDFLNCSITVNRFLNRMYAFQNRSNDFLKIFCKIEMALIRHRSYEGYASAPKLKVNYW